MALVEHVSKGINDETGSQSVCQSRPRWSTQRGISREEGMKNLEVAHRLQVPKNWDT
jgi:hypothetical protein